MTPKKKKELPITIVFWSIYLAELVNFCDSCRSEIDEFSNEGHTDCFHWAEDARNRSIDTWNEIKREIRRDAPKKK